MLRIILLILLAGPAHSATLDDVAGLKALLPGVEIKIRDSRTVIMFRAMSTEVAECWVLRGTKTLSELKQQGYLLDQISIAKLAQPLTKHQCYATPINF